jgi:hypothetical protein
MALENIEDILNQVQVSIDHPQFYSRVYSALITKCKEEMAKDGNNFKRICCEEFNKLSLRVERTELQESSSVRNVLRTRRLANLLIGDKGELNLAALPNLIEFHRKCLYSLGPDRQYDAPRQEHILKVLQLLNDNKELQRAVRLISRPFQHKQAEQIIRDTLQVPANIAITDAHARRAALSAWMCYLRQNVGSCFATAPAIIIHDDQPEQFFKDLHELMGTGRIKRTFGGVEYSAPLSVSWGSGDLRKRVRMPRQITSGMNEIWESPALMAAMEASELIKADDKLKDRLVALKELVANALRTWPEPGEACIISPEDLIKEILLQHYNLTRQDVEDYQNRPLGMIHTSLLMQVQTTGKLASKGEQCAHFLQQFDVAKNAFKALADNALLKAWEFTLASFAETKADFARWNLYTSLGLRPNDKGGIGPALLEIIQRKLDEANRKVEEFQMEYEQVYAQVKYLEGRIRSANTEKEIAWLKAEYQSRGQEFYTLEEMRNRLHHRAKRFANLFDVLIDIYYELFPNYFQEVYDADMRDVSVGQYDDSPAGFRLLYKYGRSNTSAWTKIYTPNEFVQALASFFTTTETEVMNDQRLVGLDEDMSEIITKIVTLVKTQEFLENSLYRMAMTHQGRIIEKPLENLDKIDKKPWAYTSGGTMDTLVSCYYKREQKPTEVGRWVESEVELLSFLLETVKQIPYNITEEYTQKPKKGMLIHSPTHAFLLKPGYQTFREGWQNDSLSYIWVRDNIVQPMQAFVDSQRLNDHMNQTLFTKLEEQIPHDFVEKFKEVFSHIPGNLSVKEFRKYVLDLVRDDSQLRYLNSIINLPTAVDSLLYSMLPFFPIYQLKERLEKIFEKITHFTSEDRKKLMQIYETASERRSTAQFLSASDLQNIAKAIILMHLGVTSTPVDYHKLVAQACQQLNYAYPLPINFADTNWVKEEFGFVVNPGTGKFELWCLDYIGSKGFPMSFWAQWMNGSRKDRTWGIYTRPNEYTS